MTKTNKPVSKKKKKIVYDCYFKRLDRKEKEIRRGQKGQQGQERLF